MNRRPYKVYTSASVIAAVVAATMSGAYVSPASARPVTISSTDVAASTSSSCSSIKTGGSLTWGVNDDVIDLDPDSTQDPTSIQAELMVYDQLVRLNPAGTAVIPDLAESWSSTPDGKVWTFHLRPGIKFSNGQPITAQDVAYSFNRDRSPSSVVNWTLAAIALGQGRQCNDVPSNPDGDYGLFPK